MGLEHAAPLIKLFGVSVRQDCSAPTIFMVWRSTRWPFKIGSGRPTPCNVTENGSPATGAAGEVVKPVTYGPMTPLDHNSYSPESERGLRHQPPPLPNPRLFLALLVFGILVLGAKTPVCKMHCTRSPSAKNCHDWQPKSRKSIHACWHWQDVTISSTFSNPPGKKSNFSPQCLRPGSPHCKGKSSVTSTPGNNQVCVYPTRFVTSACKSPRVGRCLRVPNTKSRFWSKKNLNFEAKMKIWGFSTLLNSNLRVSNRNSKGIRESDLQILKIEFWVRKLKIEFEFLVLRCRFLSFGKGF